MVIGHLLRAYERVAKWFAAPVLVFYFLHHRVGQEYGVGFFQKLKLIWQFRANHRRIKTASSWYEHLTMAAKILDIPRTTEGDVIECGCYKGGSTANLSLVCALTNRKLLVFDSFEGLPDPKSDDRVHQIPVTGQVIAYERGQYAGALEEVRSNLARYGNLDVCEFHQGFFKSTMPHLDRKIVFAYVDVDLKEALEDCLIGIWPRLQDGCYFFSHEAQVVAYVAKFFDIAWWKSKLKTNAPGFIGAGIGLPVMGIRRGSQIGYTCKWISEADALIPKRKDALQF